MKNKILPIIAFATFTASAQQKPISVDLNNDGVKDKIEIIKGTVTIKDDVHNQTSDKLIVNGTALEYSGQFEAIKIVDINTEDEFKEILIEAQGPAGIEYSYFWYNKKKELISMSDNSIGSIILGNGIVYGGRNHGYCPVTIKYVLTKEHKFEEVVADYYSVDKKYKVNQSFALHNQFDATSKVIANVAEKSTITIVAETKGGWVLIKTSHDLLGWAQIGEICSKLENCVFAG